MKKMIEVVAAVFIDGDTYFCAQRKELITRYFVNYEKIAVDGAGCCHADSGLWK